MTRPVAPAYAWGMRSVDELAPLGFQDFGGAWVRYEYGVGDFTLQLGVRSYDGATWEQLEAYVGHAASSEQLWWTFDLAGYETGAGGDVYALLAAAGVEGDHVVVDLREAAAAAVQSVTSALAH